MDTRGFWVEISHPLDRKASLAMLWGKSIRDFKERIMFVERQNSVS